MPGDVFRSPKEAEDALTLFVDEAARLCTELKTLLHQHHAIQGRRVEPVNRPVTDPRALTNVGHSNSSGRPCSLERQRQCSWGFTASPAPSRSLPACRSRSPGVGLRSPSPVVGAFVASPMLSPRWASPKPRVLQSAAERFQSPARPMAHEGHFQSPGASPRQRLQSRDPSPSGTWQTVSVPSQRQASPHREERSDTCGLRPRVWGQWTPRPPDPTAGSLAAPAGEATRGQASSSTGVSSHGGSVFLRSNAPVSSGGVRVPSRTGSPAPASPHEPRRGSVTVTVTPLVHGRTPLGHAARSAADALKVSGAGSVRSPSGLRSESDDWKSPSAAKLAEDPQSHRDPGALAPRQSLSQDAPNALSPSPQQPNLSSPQSSPLQAPLLASPHQLVHRPSRSPTLEGEPSQTRLSSSAGTSINGRPPGAQAGCSVSISPANLPDAYGDSGMRSDSVQGPQQVQASDTGLDCPSPPVPIAAALAQAPLAVRDQERTSDGTDTACSGLLSYASIGASTVTSETASLTCTPGRAGMLQRSAQAATLRRLVREVPRNVRSVRAEGTPEPLQHLVNRCTGALSTPSASSTRRICDSEVASVSESATPSVTPSVPASLVAPTGSSPRVCHRKGAPGTASSTPATATPSMTPASTTATTPSTTTPHSQERLQSDEDIGDLPLEALACVSTIEPESTRWVPVSGHISSRPPSGTRCGSRHGARSPSRSLSRDSHASPSNSVSPSRMRVGSMSRARSPTSPGRSRASRIPAPRGHTLWQMFHGALGEQELLTLVEELLFSSLPRCNVGDLAVAQVGSDGSKERFLRAVQDDGGNWLRVRVAWHLAGSREAAESITVEGIRCEEAHCRVGRYGRGGYVALTAAKANAYADSSVENALRHLFLVLVLPDERVVQGERGVRPTSTAADLPSHPTEYCFVDPSRLHCACLLTYRWVKTSRRSPWRQLARLPPMPPPR